MFWAYLGFCKKIFRYHYWMKTDVFHEWDQQQVEGSVVFFELWASLGFSSLVLVLVASLCSRGRRTPDCLVPPLWDRCGQKYTNTNLDNINTHKVCVFFMIKYSLSHLYWVSMWEHLLWRFQEVFKLHKNNWNTKYLRTELYCQLQNLSGQQISKFPSSSTGEDGTFV